MDTLENNNAQTEKPSTLGLIVGKISKRYNAQRKKLGLIDKPTQGILLSALFDVYVESQIAVHYDYIEKTVKGDNGFIGLHRVDPKSGRQEALVEYLGRFFDEKATLSVRRSLIRPFLLGETFKEYTDSDDTPLSSFINQTYQAVRRIFRIAHNALKLVTMIPLRIIDFTAQVLMEKSFLQANDFFNKANDSKNPWIKRVGYGIGGATLSLAGTISAAVHGAAKLSFLVTRAAISPKESFNIAYHIHPVLGGISMATTIVTQALIVGPFAAVGIGATGIISLSSVGSTIGSGLSGMTGSMVTATSWLATHLGFNGLTAAESIVGFAAGVALSATSTLPTLYSRAKQFILGKFNHAKDNTSSTPQRTTSNSSSLNISDSVSYNPCMQSSGHSSSINKFPEYNYKTLKRVVENESITTNAAAMFRPIPDDPHLTAHSEENDGEVSSVHGSRHNSFSASN